MTQVLNRAMRRGLAVASLKTKRFKQKTFNMGAPLVDLDKALSLAYEWDDQRTIERMKNR